MWDPRTYRDTDYGLDDDEEFAPFDADLADDVDLSAPHVMTVLGPIAPDQLGMCLHREHVLGDASSGVAGPGVGRLDFASAELEMFFTAGGRAMVDVTTRAYGRDVEGLRALAQRVPVHLIAATGCGDEVQDAAPDVDALAEEFLAEIRDGIGPSAIRPGVLVWDADSAAPTERTMTIAKSIAVAASQTGYPVLASSRDGALAREHLDALERFGIAPDRVVVGHLDSRLEWDTLRSLAERGAWIGFDQIGGDGDDAAKAAMMVRLAEAGHADRLLVSQGLTRPKQGLAAGGPGWIHIPEHFALALMDAGAPAELVRRILIHTPAIALAIQPIQP